MGEGQLIFSPDPTDEEGDQPLLQNPFARVTSRANAREGQQMQTKSDLLSVYPEAGQPVRVIAQLREVAKRWELEIAFAVAKNGSVSWTLDVGRELTIGSSENVAKEFSARGTRFFHALTEGVSAEYGSRNVVDRIKSEDGAPFVASVELQAEFGLQTPTSHEYFLFKNDELIGQLLFEKQQNLGDAIPWLATLTDSKFIPNAVLKGAPMPPEGVSALPTALEAVIPESFRYWKWTTDEATFIRDAIVSSDVLETVRMLPVDGQLAVVKHTVELVDAPIEIAVGKDLSSNWPLLKMASMRAGDRFGEIFAPTRDELQKVSSISEAAFFDAGDVDDGLLVLAAKAFQSHSHDFVVTSFDSPRARVEMRKLGRVFKFAPSDTVGIDTAKRIFVASFGVRGDDVRWVDKDGQGDPDQLRVYSEPSDDSPDLGKSKEKKSAEFNNPEQGGAGDVKPGSEELEKKIEHRADGYHVMSEDGSKHLGGPYASKDQAVERLRQVEGHKEKADLQTGGPGTLQPAVQWDIAGNPKIRDPKEKFLKSISAKDAGDEHYVLGIVLEPDEVDAQKDIYSADEVRNAAHLYMAEYQNRGLMHKELVNGKVDLLESYLAPVDFAVGDQQVKAGTWLMAVRVKDPALWNQVKTGGLTGFSIGGTAQRTPDAKANKKYEMRKETVTRKTSFQDIPISIDRPKGHIQQGVDDTGKEWSREYLNDYGFIPRTKGGDGEGIDVYIGPDGNSPLAYWVTQRKLDGSFDEYKVILGTDSIEAAKRIYLQHTPEKYFGGIREGTVAQIKALLNLHPSEQLEKVFLEMRA